MRKEEGQSIALINVMVIVGLISLAFIMSNYGVLTFIRRLTQTGADAAALAAADYLADNLTVTYKHPCPNTINKWKRVKYKLTEEGVWDYYLHEYYLRYLEYEDYRWKNQIRDYLGFHRAAIYRDVDISDYSSPGIFALPQEIWIFVEAKGDSPLTSPQFYSADSIEVHAAAEAHIERVLFNQLEHECKKIDEYKGRYEDDRKSGARRECNRAGDIWERDGLNTKCIYQGKDCVKNDKETRICIESEYEYEYKLYVWIIPIQFGIEVDWESKGLRPVNR